ncbi:hypothetical protein [Stenotrophomonas sp. MMGLT7]|uniref:hypothetical protein n=1 Tax=Stenotrophomonas sp. MMGLT7 TaxID=2901227 RepID=UPI001E34D706|nr:hypothetical protein [Stenotrophomonas sp. MMGLT7]MCD7097476.1 hypothetical protein [Stenotrophomonas sp. MMGLT7]
MSIDEVNELRRHNRLLKAGLAIACLVAVVVLLSGAKVPKGRAVFLEIDVGRINVVADDGSRSMVLAARGRTADAIVNGNSLPGEQPRMPGIVFYNGVGDEVGGLIYDGKLDASGKPGGGVHFSMERFGGDPQLAVHHYQDNGFMETGLSVYDRGFFRDYDDRYRQYQHAPEGPQKAVLPQRWKDAGGRQTQWLFVGRTRGDASALVLADAGGKPRIMMTVTREGVPALQFLDNQDNVMQSLPEGGASLVDAS